MATRKKTTRGAGSGRRSAATGAKASLRLDAVLYPRRSIGVAKDAFSHLAEIGISKDGGWFVISFSGMSKAIAARMPDEFANYVLSVTVAQP